MAERNKHQEIFLQDVAALLASMFHENAAIHTQLKEENVFAEAKLEQISKAQTADAKQEHLSEDAQNEVINLTAQVSKLLQEKLKIVEQKNLLQLEVEAKSDKNCSWKHSRVV